MNSHKQRTLFNTNRVNLAPLLPLCHFFIFGFSRSRAPAAAAELHLFYYDPYLQREVPVVTGIYLHALFVCLKQCLSEEAATKAAVFIPSDSPCHIRFV